MKEWKINEKLPRSFVILIKEAISEICYQQQRAFFRVSEEWEIHPAILSRWMAGFGPLNQEDIFKLAKAIGPVIYITLGLIRPE